MRELLEQTWSNLRANRLRSFLTMFGIAWGVMAIVILAATGEGFQRGNTAVLRELGQNIVIVRNGRTSLQAGGERAGRIVRLNVDDVHALKALSRRIDLISPELMRGATRAKSDFNSSTLQMSGIWPDYQTMRTLEVDRGRLLTQADGDQAQRVVLMGTDAARLLFADRDPIGRQVLLNGVPYTVTGRIRKKFQDSNYTGWDNERLFIPYETMRRDFPLPGEFNGPDSLSAVIARSRPWVVRELRDIFEGGRDFMQIAFSRTSPMEQEIRDILGPRKGFDPKDTEALMFWNTALESVMFDKMIAAMKEFFLMVSLVTLALGGIGVMNIMLITVKERTREIGLRKALGATSRSIHRQFFVEGLLLTVVSGAIGLVLGAGLCSLVNLLPMPERFSGMAITWQIAVLTVVILALVGVLASTYPARRAAALPPVEALRYDA